MRISSTSTITFIENLICTKNKSILFISYVSTIKKITYCLASLSLSLNQRCGHFCLWSRAKYDLIWCTYSTSSRFLQRRKGNYISSVKMRSGQLKRIYRKMRFFCASTVVTCVAWLGTPRAHIDAFWLDLFRWGLNKLKQTHHIHSYFYSSK